MNQVTLCVTVAFLTVTGLLSLGCLGSHWLRNHLDAATRLQRVCLVAVFAVLGLYAIIASVPASRYPFLSSLQASNEELTAEVPVAAPAPILPATLPPAPRAVPAPVARPVRGSEPVEEKAFPHISVKGWVAGVWLAGAAVSLSYLVYGHLCLLRLRHRSGLITSAALLAEVTQLAEEIQTECPEVRQHPDNQGPLLAGVNRPTLYIPVTLPEEATLRRMLLRHELAHLVRRDVAFLLLSRVLCALVWWHPLAYRLARQMEQTAEEASDAYAVQGQASRSTPDYTRFLLEQASSVRPTTTTTMTAGICTPRSQVGKRIARLLGPSVDKPVSGLLRGGMVTMALLLVTAGAVVQSSLSAPPKPPTAALPMEETAYHPTVEEFRQAFATSANVAGNRNARFQVMEFSDFECPSCRRANQPAPWRLGYPQLQTEFRHLPLTNLHPNAARAAELAQEYAVNDNFWTAHDLLFAGQDLRAEIALVERQNEKKDFMKSVREANRIRGEIYAKAKTQQARNSYRVGIGLTSSKLTEEMKRSLNQVSVDKALAAKWEVRSTPTYFVLDKQNHTVHRFAGYTAWKAYLQSLVKGASTFNPKNALAIKAPNVLLTSVLDMLFKLNGFQYKVEPGLDLTNVKINATIHADNFFDALDKIQQASPVPFVIRPMGNDAKVVTLAPLPPHGTVTGRLTYPDGRPAVGFEIYADRWEQDLFSPRTQPNQGAAVNPDAEALYGERTLTDSTGRFTLRRLGNFRYNVSASLPDVNHKAVPQDWVAPAIEGVRPQVNESRDIGTIRLVRGGIVRGRVTDQNGKPLAKFYIGSHGPHRPDTSGSVYPTETDAKGYYELRLPPGKSYVYVGMQHYRQELMPFMLREGETKTVNMVAKPE